MSSENIAIVQTHYDLFNQRDSNPEWADQAAARVSPSFSWRVIPTGQNLQGVAGYLEFVNGWASTFSDSRVDIQNVIASNGQVVSEAVFRGTHDGTLMTPMGPIPATGKSVALPICDIFQLADGKISGAKVYFDLATMLGQLGLMPPKPDAG